MTVRETLNKQAPAVKAAIIGSFIAVAGIALWCQFSSGKPPNATSAYYSSDDGQTTFTDDFFRSYPFDHGGQPAYRAYMFQTGKGKQFVGYLERYTDNGVKQLEPVLSMSTSRENIRQAIQDVRTRYTEVKKPNDPTAKWCRVGSAEAASVQAVTSPDGPEDNCILIFP